MTRTVHYHNAMGRGSYELTAPRGYPDPAFRPDYTPMQMLRLGVFGGCYLNSAREEYPRSWFRGVALCARPTAAANHFGVLSGQSLGSWQRRGWIHEQDPRGWFEWWSRYYSGRRTDDDARQISRWRSFTARHGGQLVANLRRYPEKARDPMSYPVQKQALLQWACDWRKIKST